MTREEKIEKVRDIIRKGTNFTIIATEIVDCLEEPDDDLTPGDICEVQNNGRAPKIKYYCGTDCLRRKTFSTNKSNVGRPNSAPSYDHYRKFDVFDVLPKAIKVVDLLLDNTQVVDRLHRPEGR
jgi:hypothetical protein